VADTVLQSFVIKLKYEFDEAAAKKFRDSISNSVGQLNAFRLAVIGAITGVEELVRRTTTGFGQLSYAAKSANVSAEAMEKLRASLVGAGRSADEAAPLLNNLYAQLRDPVQRAQLEGWVQHTGHFANGVDVIAAAVKEYGEVVKAYGGDEVAAGISGQMQMLKMAFGGNLEAIRALWKFQAEAKETADASETMWKRIAAGGGPSVQKIYDDSAKMERTFWTLGNTMRGVFAEFLFTPDKQTGKTVVDAINDVAVAFSKWLIDPETQKAVREIAASIANFFNDPNARKDFAEDMKAIGRAVIDIAHAIDEVWKFFKNTFGPELGTVMLVGIFAFRRAIVTIIGALGKQLVGLMFGPLRAAAPAAGAAVGAGVRQGVQQGAGGGRPGGVGNRPSLWSMAGGPIGMIMAMWEAGVGREGYQIERTDTPENQMWGGLGPYLWKKWMGTGHAAGGIVPSALHAGEMVLPSSISAGLMGFFSGGGGSFVETSRRLLQSFLGWFAGDTSYKPQVDLSDTTLEKMGYDPNKGTGTGAGSSGAGSSGAGSSGAGSGDGGSGWGRPGGLPAGATNLKGSAQIVGTIVDTLRKAGASEATIQAMLAATQGEGGVEEAWKGGDVGPRFGGAPGEATSFGPWQLHKHGALDAYLAGGGKPGDVAAQTAYVYQSLLKLNPNLAKLTPEQVIDLMHRAPRAGGFGDYGALTGNLGKGAQLMRQFGTGGGTATGGGGSMEGVINTMMAFLGEYQDNPHVREFMKQNAGNFDPMSAAWCAAFLNASLGKNGLFPNTNAMASSFKNFGDSVQRGQEQRGDVAMVGSDFHHVGVVLQHVGNMVQMIAGNTQGVRGHRQVAIDWYREDELTFRRRHEEVLRRQQNQQAAQTKPTVVQHVTYNVNESHSPTATAKQIKYTQDRSLAALQRNNRVYMA